MNNEKETVVEEAPQSIEAKDVAQEESSTSKPENTQQASADETGSGKGLPFNKDPEIQKYIDRMISKKEQGWSKQIQELKDNYTKQLEMFNAQRASQGKPEVNQLPPEQEQAVMQLAEILFNHPKIREKYGLDEISKVKEQLNQSSSEATRQLYETEIDTVTTEYATKYGYDKEELRDDLENFINSDPWFQDKQYHRGSMSKAAKLFFSGKEQELADRASNLKLIKEQKEKKSAATESPSKGDKGTSKATDKTLEGFLDRRVQEGGGLKFD